MLLLKINNLLAQSIDRQTIKKYSVPIMRQFFKFYNQNVFPFISIGHFYYIEYWNLHFLFQRIPSVFVVRRSAPNQKNIVVAQCRDYLLNESNSHGKCAIQIIIKSDQYSLRICLIVSYILCSGVTKHLYQ